MFPLKFGVCHSSKCYFGQVIGPTIYTLPIFHRVRVRAKVRFNVQIKYSNFITFKNSPSASCLVRELSRPRVGLSASCLVSKNYYV